MPTPGSHGYDVQRTRLRGRLESEGVNDQHADEAANAILQRQSDAVSPAARSDRAGGPYGERGGGGDPGAVIGLRSPAFSDGAFIPPRFTRDGDDVSPALEWSDVPDGTVELALLFEDPDAPSGLFVHWLVTGIDPSTRAIGEGEVPPGAYVWENGYGERGYGGPEPPVGDDPHRYVFRLYALGSPLGLAPGASIDDVRAGLDDTRIATGTLTGLFVR
jgi:Raf kinase inhibitor-like YbhB/YbcL family protein